MICKHCGQEKPKLVTPALLPNVHDYQRVTREVRTCDGDICICNDLPDALESLQEELERYKEWQKAKEKKEADQLWDV